MCKDAGGDTKGELQVGERLGERGQVVGDDDVPKGHRCKRSDGGLPQRLDQRESRGAKEEVARQQAEDEIDGVQRAVAHEPRPPRHARRL